MAAKKAPKSVKPNGRGAKAPQSKSTRKTASKKKAKTAPATSSPSTHYIRNLHSGAGGARIDLQTSDTRINLEPRGRRGDLRLVNEEIINDPMYQHNLGVIFEEVSLEEGKEIIAKQSINQQEGNSVWDVLTNEKGEKYDPNTRATITAPFEQQGVTVANLSPGANGKATEGNVDITRAVQPTDHFSGPQGDPNQGLGPQQVQVPGSQPVFNPDVLPAGLSVEQAQLYIETPREQRQRLFEEWQRQALEAEAYRSGLNVSVQPTERE